MYSKKPVSKTAYWHICNRNRIWTVCGWFYESCQEKTYCQRTTIQGIFFNQFHEWVGACWYRYHPVTHSLSGMITTGNHTFERFAAPCNTQRGAKGASRHVWLKNSLRFTNAQTAIKLAACAFYIHLKWFLPFLPRRQAFGLYGHPQKWNHSALSSFRNTGRKQLCPSLYPRMTAPHSLDTLWISSSFEHLPAL